MDVSDFSRSSRYSVSSECLPLDFRSQTPKVPRLDSEYLGVNPSQTPPSPSPSNKHGNILDSPQAILVAGSGAASIFSNQGILREQHNPDEVSNFSNFLNEFPRPGEHVEWQGEELVLANPVIQDVAHKAVLVEVVNSPNYGRTTSRSHKRSDNEGRKFSQCGILCSPPTLRTSKVLSTKEAKARFSSPRISRTYGSIESRLYSSASLEIKNLAGNMALRVEAGKADDARKAARRGGMVFVDVPEILNEVITLPLLGGSSSEALPALNLQSMTELAFTSYSSSSHDISKFKPEASPCVPDPEPAEQVRFRNFLFSTLDTDEYRRGLVEAGKGEAFMHFMFSTWNGASYGRRIEKQRSFMLAWKVVPLPQVGECQMNRLAQLGDKVMETIFRSLDPCSATCLGLTSKRTYQIYKLQYPSRMSLWECCIQPGLQVTKTLGSLLESWMGPKYRRHIWGMYSNLGDQAFEMPQYLLSSVYGKTENKRDTALAKRYQDYFKARERQRPGLQYGKLPWVLPSPFSQGNRWYKEALEIIRNDIVYYSESELAYWNWEKWMMFWMDYDVFSRMGDLEKLKVLDKLETITLKNMALKDGLSYCAAGECALKVVGTTKRIMRLASWWYWCLRAVEPWPNPCFGPRALGLNKVPFKRPWPRPWVSKCKTTGRPASARSCALLQNRSKAI